MYSYSKVQNQAMKTPLATTKADNTITGGFD